ncbi:MAG: heme utilization cystosolic carrier protein HutX [Ruminobacter sp.]|nr:heme utilization cystosolic carrier protein HutX [Ruminobacter sp.]
MENSCTSSCNINKEDLKNKALEIIKEGKLMGLATLAQKLNLSPLESAKLLEGEFSKIISGDNFKSVWEGLTKYSTATIIIKNKGSVFEVKSKLSSGKDGMGYYNIFASNDCALGGHINASNIKFIGFLELPFIKFKTANVTFFTEDGEEMFSVSVGCNAKHELLEEDLAIFNNLKESF